VRLTPRDLALLVDRFNVLFGTPQRRRCTSAVGAGHQVAAAGRIRAGEVAPAVGFEPTTK